ncbi:unnamed protein product [Phytomonas sp. EM1]|nr:unnamed protein product [Phytomonas sp. EM1]|eukprot:CCW65354.1 unnamed protein product [Phytomonas sp. isolate EM1]
MLRVCCKRYVVFTQGIPHLRTFADHFFLKTHPLRSSNVWLDEKDFEINQKCAFLLGKPDPLRINPMSHHPERSPYAKMRRKPKHHKTTTPVSSPLSLPLSTTQANADAMTGSHAESSVNSRTTSKSVEWEYKVPICSSYLYRHLFLYNLEQMVLLRDPDSSPSPMCFSSLPPSRSTAAHALRDRFPEPKGSSSTKGHFSIHTRRAFSEFLQPQLQQLQHTHQYDSRWWGTVMQWKRLEVMPRPLQQPHIVFIKLYSKLVHISLIDNAEEILMHSYISGKSGVFHCLNLGSDLDDNPNHAHHTPSLAKTQGGMSVGHRDPEMEGIGPMGPSISGTTRNIAKADIFFPFMTNNRAFAFNIIQDMKLHQYTVPLYFSAIQLRQYKLSLRCDASGISFQELSTSLPPSLKHVDEAQEEDPSYEGSPSVAPLKRYFYHLSQVSFPESFRIPPHVIAAELEHTAGQPLHGISGAPLPYVRLLEENLLLQNPNLAAVLRAPCHGGRGETDSSPCLDAQTTAKDSVRELSDDALKALLEGRASPAVHNGRSLWFSAEDILQHGGIVDVNATPVEVSGHDTFDYTRGNIHNSAGEGGLSFDTVCKNNANLKHKLFNVDCLVNPNEGYRIINQRVPS